MYANTTKVQKYWKLLTLFWQNGLVYRMSVFMWRVRRFLVALMSLTIWLTIYASSAEGATPFGYGRSSMMSYIFLVSVLQSFISATALDGLAQDVYTGTISNHLLKPISLYGYFIVQELADKLRNTTAMIFEFIALFVIFRPEFVKPSLSILGLFVLWVLGALILKFCFSLLLGSLGFWSPKTWAPRFLFYSLLKFVGGQLFPLEVLPETIQKIIYATPLPYFSFIQTQLFLGKVSGAAALRHTLILAGWIVILGLSAKIIWNKGLRDYDAAGR